MNKPKNHLAFTAMGVFAEDGEGSGSDWKYIALDGKLVELDAQGNAVETADVLTHEQVLELLAQKPDDLNYG